MTVLTTYLPYHQTISNLDKALPVMSRRLGKPWPPSGSLPPYRHLLVSLCIGMITHVGCIWLSFELSG